LLQRGDRELHRLRYRFAPQLRAYDTFGYALNPHVTYSSPPNMNGDVVSTDKYGFRRSWSSEGWIDSETEISTLHGVVLGGSTVFGVGASGDMRTVVSVIASERSEKWMNLGIRGGNSSQELAAALPYVAAPVKILIVTGANNLIIALQAEAGALERYSPLYQEYALAVIADFRLAHVAEALDHKSSLRAHLRLWALRQGRKVRLSYGSPSGRPKWGHGDRVARPMWESMRLAAERQLRDLDVLARACEDRDRITFITQPMANRSDRLDDSRERALLGLWDVKEGPRWQEVADFASARWDDYSALLESGCRRLGVRFHAVSAREMEGWAFVDRVHLTDAGYSQLGKLACQAC
jgi:hypothetical protein